MSYSYGTGPIRPASDFPTPRAYQAYLSSIGTNKALFQAEIAKMQESRDFAQSQLDQEMEQQQRQFDDKITEQRRQFDEELTFLTLQAKEGQKLDRQKVEDARWAMEQEIDLAEKSFINDLVSTGASIATTIPTIQQMMAETDLLKQEHDITQQAWRSPKIQEEFGFRGKELNKGFTSSGGYSGEMTNQQLWDKGLIDFGSARGAMPELSNIEMSTLRDIDTTLNYADYGKIGKDATQGVSSPNIGPTRGNIPTTTTPVSAGTVPTWTSSGAAGSPFMTYQVQGDTGGTTIDGMHSMQWKGEGAGSNEVGLGTKVGAGLAAAQQGYGAYKTIDASSDSFEGGSGEKYARVGGRVAGTVAGAMLLATPAAPFAPLAMTVGGELGNWAGPYIDEYLVEPLEHLDDYAEEIWDEFDDSIFEPTRDLIYDIPVIGGVVEDVGDVFEDVGDWISDPCIIVTTATHRHSPEVNVCRRFRDAHMPPAMQRGYYIIADQVVPLMKQSDEMMQTVKEGLVAHLVEYCSWRMGDKKTVDPVSKQVTEDFLSRCESLGSQVTSYRRSCGTGEEV